MKRLGSIAFALSMTMGTHAFAAESSEAGFESFDTSLESVNVNQSVEVPDYETIFVKQDKEFPEQVGEMIQSEKAAWDEHAKKLDKAWWDQGIDYCKSYRYGFRHSFYNGYRYSTRNIHGYSYNTSYSNNHRYAYEYSYRNSYRNSWSRSISVSINVNMSRGYRGGYQNAYRGGYSYGRRNHCR